MGKTKRVKTRKNSNTRLMLGSVFFIVIEKCSEMHNFLATKILK